MGQLSDAPYPGRLSSHPTLTLRQTIQSPLAVVFGDPAGQIQYALRVHRPFFIEWTIPQLSICLCFEHHKVSQTVYSSLDLFVAELSPVSGWIFGQDVLQAISRAVKIVDRASEVRFQCEQEIANDLFVARR